MGHGPPLSAAVEAEGDGCGVGCGVRPWNRTRLHDEHFCEGRFGALNGGLSITGSASEKKGTRWGWTSQYNLYPGRRNPEAISMPQAGHAPPGGALRSRASWAGLWRRAPKPRKTIVPQEGHRLAGRYGGGENRGTTGSPPKGPIVWCRVSHHSLETLMRKPAASADLHFGQTNGRGAPFPDWKSINRSASRISRRCSLSTR